MWNQHELPMLRRFMLTSGSVSWSYQRQSFTGPDAIFCMQWISLPIPIHRACVVLLVSMLCEFWWSFTIIVLIIPQSGAWVVIHSILPVWIVNTPTPPCRHFPQTGSWIARESIQCLASSRESLFMNSTCQWPAALNPLNLPNSIRGLWRIIARVWLGHCQDITWMAPTGTKLRNTLDDSYKREIGSRVFTGQLGYFDTS